MGTVQDNNRVRQMRLDSRFSDLTHPDAPARLTSALAKIVDEINKDRLIENMPVPTGLSAESKSLAIKLSWDDLPAAYKGSVDGARIWRAAQAQDSETDFNKNNAKSVHVNVLKSTNYTDQVGNTGAFYIYWVEWVNLDGKASGPSNAVVAQALWDNAAPGAVGTFSVTTNGGLFIAKWIDPFTNINTLDCFGFQYAKNSTFSTSQVTVNVGKIYSVQNSDPGASWYFRIAAHNLSGDTTSNTDTDLNAMLSGGWGPWAEPLEGNPITSSAVTVTDSVLPGVPLNTTFYSSMGKFVGEWDLPSTGNNTIDDVCISGAADAAYTQLVDTSIHWGVMRHAESRVPNATRYLQVAWHNQSGLASNTFTRTTIEATGRNADYGWGSFCTVMGPVTTGDLMVDSVLPGAPTNFTFSGSQGRYSADWDVPATGFSLLDDVCIQGASNSAFTADVDTSFGWGVIYHAETSLPNTTRYMRVAWKNLSGIASTTFTKTTLEAKYGAHCADYGWGPFCAAIGPISSGQISFASATSGARVAFSSTLGFVGYNSSGATISQINPTTGLHIFKSATSGARYEIDPSNGIKAYDSSGVNQAFLSTDGYLYCRQIRNNYPAYVQHIDFATWADAVFITDSTGYLELKISGETSSIRASNNDITQQHLVYQSLAASSRQTWNIHTSKRMELTNSTLTLTAINLALDSGKTVDGVDISALGSTFSTHITASSTHGVSGAIVGTTDSQTLTNKYVDSDTVGKGVWVRHYTSAPTWANEANGIFTFDIGGERGVGWYQSPNRFTVTCTQINAF